MREKERVASYARDASVEPNVACGVVAARGVAVAIVIIAFVGVA